MSTGQALHGLLTSTKYKAASSRIQPGGFTPGTTWMKLTYPTFQKKRKIIDSNVPAGTGYGDRSNTCFVQFYSMYPTKIMGNTHMFSHKSHMNHLFYQVIPLTCDSKISMWSNNERLGPNSQKICRRFLFCCQQVLSYRSLLHHTAKLHFWGKYQYHMFLPCLFIQCRFHLSNAYLFKYKSISSCFIEITTPHDKQQKPYEAPSKYIIIV